MKNLWAIMLGLAMIVAAVMMALTRDVTPKTDLGATQFGPDKRNGEVAAIVAKDSPVIVGFVGDLAVGGDKRTDGQVIPFVIGELLELNAEALNAVEYRWSCNGEVVKDDEGNEWSKKKTRLFPVNTAAEFKFALQVRGARADQLSQPKEAIVKTVSVFIEDFEAAINQEDDRCLTGEDFTVQVTLAEPITADSDFYELRYLVNDVPVKHPDDGLEWTSERDFSYTFPTPGQYSFKVEVRRAGQKEPEANAVLAETIVVADAVVLSFDVTPDKYAALGTTVNMSMFPESIFGKSECRFGFKKVAAADFEWVPEADGTVWGEASRNWLPTEPGNYLLRGEVREAGKKQTEDYREILYTVVEGDF
jgi:hypothetical protein